MNLPCNGEHLVARYDLVIVSIKSPKTKMPNGQRRLGWDKFSVLVLVELGKEFIDELIDSLLLGNIAIPCGNAI